VGHHLEKEYSMPGLVLFALSLGFMLFRVASPMSAKTEGKLVREVSLNYRERMAMQQMNLVALAVILLLGAVGHWLTLPFELLAMVAAYGILMVPVRYRLTNVGIAINGVVFRRWSEFGDIKPSTQKLVLIGRPGNGRFAIWVRGTHQNEVLPLLRRNVQGSSRQGETPATPKGGPQEGHLSFRRLLARRS
jgi:hypothetical protein